MLVQGLAQGLEPGRVLRDERIVDPALGDEVLHDAVDECDVATRVDLEEGVGKAGAKEGAVEDGGNPIPFKPGLTERIHDRDFRAVFLRVVQVFRRHRLIVWHVGTEEHDQVAADPVGVGAGGCRHAQRFLHGRCARGVAEAGRVIDVVRPQKPGDLASDVVDLVRDAP